MYYKNRFQSSFSVKIVPLSAFCAVLRSMTELRPENDGDLQDDLMNMCSTEFQKIRNPRLCKAWLPTISVEFTDAGQALALCWYTLYQQYMTLQSKKWKMLCRKKMVGQGDFSATRSRLSPEGLARKALRKDPLSNSFSSIATFSVEKLTHILNCSSSKSASVPLSSLRWVEKVSFSYKNCR